MEPCLYIYITKTCSQKNSVFRKVQFTYLKPNFYENYSRRSCKKNQ